MIARIYKFIITLFYFLLCIFILFHCLNTLIIKYNVKVEGLRLVSRMKRGKILKGCFPKDGILNKHYISTLFIKNDGEIYNKYIGGKKGTVRKRKNDIGGSVSFRRYGKDSRNPHLAYEYINKIIENKKYEVTKLLEENCDENNPLQIRMNYLQHTMNNKLSESLKRSSNDEKHRLSLIADMKRKIFGTIEKEKKKEKEHKTKEGLYKNISVGYNNLQNEKYTYEDILKNEKELHDVDIMKNNEEKKKKNINNHYIYQHNFLNLSNPGKVSLLLHEIGFDVLIVNIDELSTQGNINDLKDIIKSTRTLPRNKRPAIVVDDIIIHPIQIALAVENQADGVILNLSYLKNDMEEMLQYCVNVGTQAIVEVHDYNDIYFATQCGAYILMINEYDFYNNIYEYNHAIKAINYTIPEIITIAKVNTNEVNYIEKLGSLGYDSICLEKKLIDDDLQQFVTSCKAWSAPHKTLLYLNRNNYLKEFLTYDKNGQTRDNHKEITENLKNLYDDKNISNNYSHTLLKRYEKEHIDGEDITNDEAINGGINQDISQDIKRYNILNKDNPMKYKIQGNKNNYAEKKESFENKCIDNKNMKHTNMNKKEEILSKEEKQIVQNFKNEKKRELMLLSQMKEIIKEVDDQCKNYHTNTDEENQKKEEKLESLLENFTKLDKNFLKGFFSDEEINNIENTMKNAVEQKNKIQSGEINIDHKNLTGYPMATLQNTHMNNLDIYNLTKQYFGETQNSDGHTENILDSDQNNLLDESSEDSSRGLGSS
ncbi:conserved Plasmodium protein, unknown function [Plasmodium reichenowi]|uniref:indole-3-glycerol-phosphate synthase n=1 Tax=Plasmodium reichenowi TaxID=5854 RepID=A0A060S3W9_PLARE|nr:conserved Plasmodium protein, unknown function [Plasmodium reichenowi]